MRHPETMPTASNTLAALDEFTVTARTFGSAAADVSEAKVAPVAASIDRGPGSVVGNMAPPAINLGETYVGILFENGKPLHHLILLAGDVEVDTWDAGMQWAASIGGDLPSRVEQSLLFASAKTSFQRDWYWSNEQHASNADYAWGQGFDDGYQGDYYKSAAGRARAVRRFVI